MLAWWQWDSGWQKNDFCLKELWLVLWIKRKPSESRTCPSESRTCPSESRTCPSESRTCPSESRTCPLLLLCYDSVDRRVARHDLQSQLDKICRVNQTRFAESIRQDLQSQLVMLTQLILRKSDDMSKSFKLP